MLLNGLLSDTTMWAGVLPGLTDRFRVLTFDSRGQGRSDAPEEGPYPRPCWPQEAWDLFAALGIAASLARGPVQWQRHQPGTAGHPSRRLRRGGPHQWHARIDFAMGLRTEHWIHCLEVGGPLMQFDAAAPFLWGDAFLEPRHGVLRAYHQVVTGGAGKPLHGNLHQIRGILGWDIRERLSLIQDPVLLLCGAEDLLTPPWKCLETARRIPGSRFEIVPGIGHAYPVEDPGRIRGIDSGLHG